MQPLTRGGSKVAEPGATVCVRCVAVIDVGSLVYSWVSVLEPH